MTKIDTVAEVAATAAAAVVIVVGTIVVVVGVNHRCYCCY